jgi:hypothetical protein
VSRLTVTARGTPSDAIAGGRAVSRQLKGAWSAAARRTAFGWTAEMAIPLVLLDFAPDADTFGVNLVRYQHRTAETSEWADVTPQRLPEEAGHLTGLHLADVSTAGRRRAARGVSWAPAWTCAISRPAASPRWSRPGPTSAASTATWPASATATPGSS